MDNAGSALVSDHHESDWAPCLICNGIQDQETILTCQGCLYRTHVDCYFTAGSKDANDTITDAEEWRCENCGGLGRHLHRRPVQGQRRNVTWTHALPSSSGMRAGTGGFGGGRLGAPRTNIGSGKGKEPMPTPFWGKKVQAGLDAPRTNIDSGKGKETLPVDEDDRWMGNADMTADDSSLETTTPFKRCRTSLVLPAMMRANTAQTTIRQDMEIDNSHGPTPSASSPQIVDGQMPATGHRGIRKRAQRKHTGDYRNVGWRPLRNPKKN